MWGRRENPSLTEKRAATINNREKELTKAGKTELEDALNSINLYKKDEMNKPADSYRVRVHPGNIDRLRTTLNLLERPSGRIQVWEAFYRLK